MRPLYSETISVAVLEEADKAAMFELYDRYYAATDRARFEADLSKKTSVILIRNELKVVVGFSTLSVHRQSVENEEIDYIFSGDTILDASRWGNPTLLRAWFRTAGALKRQLGAQRLYWFPIVKGHRTFRILPNFFCRYVPGSEDDSAPELIRIRDAIATARYGNFFSSETGVVDFGRSLGHLRPEWSGVETAASRNRYAAQFLAANPQYFRGVELACLAELAVENLKRYAATCFAEGMGSAYPCEEVRARDFYVGPASC